MVNGRRSILVILIMNTNLSECILCSGEQLIEVESNRIHRNFRTMYKCPACEGTGKMITNENKN